MGTGVQVWSQTAGLNATADSGFTWAEGMSPSLVDDGARGLMASVAMWVADNNGTLATSGSSTAFTVYTNQVETALTAGYTVAVQFSATNDSSATLNVDGLGPKPLQLTAGTNLLGQEFQSGAICRFTYSSTGTGQWIANNYNTQIVSGFVSTTAKDQNFSGGCTVTSLNLGSVPNPAIGNTVTVDPGACPLQYLTNNGAFFLASPDNDGACSILVINGTTPGSISFSGFTVGASVGDPLTTTAGNQFIISVFRINGISSYFIKALQ